MDKNTMLTMLRDSVADAAEFVDLRWRKLALRHGWGQPKHLVAYRGYANTTTVWLRGRLLANRSVQSFQHDPNWWDNLRASFERFDSDEVPYAAVTLRYGSQAIQATTDAEGYFEVAFKRESKSTGTGIAHCVGSDTEIIAIHEITHADKAAQLMIISDIDDTVIHTGISDLLQAARLTFLNNSKTRKPLEGAASLYQELVRTKSGASSDRSWNPIFYVSNSPWNLYDLLDDFLDLNDFPAGPLLLRDVGIRVAQYDHKPQTLRQLLQQFESLPAILIGDSGESDAIYYAELAVEFPDRILAIYIRDVDPGQNSARDRKVDELRETSLRLKIPFLRVENSIDIANSLTALHILDSAAVERIVKDTDNDRERKEPVF